ncbi:M15 family metallopeptidase [Isoptericola jiangsuensis]|uniref:M15 family metallopeptidase n=1 Tax=Isoptericola jiangsuensis TaxID=548579 RepID=UPI003AB03BBC
MRHARDEAETPRTRATTTRRGPSKGRHSAPPARRRAAGPSSSPFVPRSWPLSIGIGLAVTMATTTGLSVAQGAPATHSAEDLGEPTPAAGTAAEPQAPVAQPQAAAAALDRRQGASRSGARTAPSTAGKTVVPVDATITAEAMKVDVKAAPEPPVLPGCDGEATGAGTNGNIAASEMCALWDGGPSIRADAAVALAHLNEAYRATFGESMCVTDGYRSYSQQVATKAAKGYLAAPPGTSNHGWGLAVDLCPTTYGGDRWAWLAANAPTYGWDNPPWARSGGSKYEPWHWEFTAAVAEAGS